MMMLGLAGQGECCEIVSIGHCGTCGDHCRTNDKHTATTTRAEEMGLRVGKRLEVLKNDGNLLLLLVDEARIAIDRKMARAIQVKGITA